MIPESINQFLNSFHNQEIHQFIPVGGGSINDAYRYSAGNDELFVKCNDKIEGIIEKEVDGLAAITNLNCVATPEVIAFEKIDNYEILVLPFIVGGLKSPKSWEKFGYQLAAMHQKPASFYGWHQSNFIGSLHQTNDNSTDFIEFFIHQRLNPQIELALNNKLLSSQDIKQFEQLFEKLNEIVPDTNPSLVHGDLWSGNFIIGEQETPYLIDPSIHYNYRETDIAFTHLFGGFDPRFYDAYNNQFPLAPGFQSRISLYNIYPLLVHLNLFGSGYYGSVISNLGQYVR